MKIVMSGLVAGCLLATGSQVWAQNTNATPTNMPPRLRAPASPPARPGGLEGILTEEQRASFQKVNTETREKLMALQPKIQAAQKEVFEAGLSPKADETLIRQKADEAGKLYADMLVIRAKVLTEIQPPLSADQLQQIKDMEAAAANPRMMRPEHAPGAPTPPSPTGLPPKQ